MSPDDDDLLAAELAFGLLDGPERGAAEARLVAEPDFAARYAAWLEHGRAWLDGGEVPPSPAVWEAIRRRLPANDAGHPPRAVRWWQASTAAASLAALALGAVVLQRPAPTPAPTQTPVPRSTVQPRPLLAILSGKGQGSVALSWDRASGRLTTLPAKLAVGPGAAELWVIPADGKPRSLGLLAPAPASVAPAAGSVPLLTDGVTVAVSREPAGGSTTGLPTGPVILTGTLTAG